MVEPDKKNRVLSFFVGYAYLYPADTSTTNSLLNATIWFIGEGQNQIIGLTLVIVIITSALRWLNTSDNEISEEYMYSSFEDLME